MAKLFSKFGAKRSENLGDLRSTSVALDTLLDRIKGGKRKFDQNDLKLIENIFVSDITTATFVSASAATVRFTSPNGTQQVYEPLITLQNRFDRAYFTTSEPFFAGGDGLTARYFDDVLIKRTTGTDSTTNWLGFDQYKDSVTGRVIGDPVLGEEKATDKDQFWEKGDFLYGNKIVNKLLTSYGGVEWTGFYKVRDRGQHSIRIYTSGFLKVEFDNIQAPSKEFTFTPSSGTFQLDDLDFKNPSGIVTKVDQTKLVNAGKITAATITGTTLTGAALNASYGTISTFISTPAVGTGASFELARNLNGSLYIVSTNFGADYVTGGTFVVSYTLIGGTSAADNAVITITETGGYEIYDSISSSTTNYELGQTRLIDVPLGTLEPFVPYKIKISFFMDEDAVRKTLLTSTTAFLQKYIQFQRIVPLIGVVDDFDYKYLYNEKYFDFYNIGDFKQFVDDSISFAGSKVSKTKTIGKQTSSILNGVGSSGSRYKTFANLNPIISYYKAPINSTVSQMTITRTGDYISGTSNINITNTGLPNKTEGIEEGNYVLADGVLTGSRVSAVILDNSVVLDLPIQTSQTNATVTFINHKGLIGFGTAGQYSDDIVPGGLVEKGFSLGTRGVSFVDITDGDSTDLTRANEIYGTFALADPTRPYFTNSGGTGATFNISRNEFGALRISIISSGSGYANYEYFTVDKDLVGNPNDITFEIKALTDTFLVGKPEYNIVEDIIFKQTNWPNTFQYSDQTDPTLALIKSSSQAALVERFQTSADSVRSLQRNCFVFKDQGANITALAATNRIWYLYESFGLNNKGLAPYCQGVYAKRIIQKLTVVNGGSGYSANVTTGLGSVVSNVSGTTGSNMRVYYLASGGSITYAWTVNDGSGYESGNVVTVSGGGANATLRVGYPANSGDASIELRLTDAKDLSTGQYAHLFPTVFFQGPDLNSLSSDVTITNITWPANANDSAALVTLSRGSAPILNSSISYTSTVVTRITFSPSSTNKEVCFKPTDTSPPFSATSRGLSTSFNVTMVRDFTTRGTADSGVANTDGKLTYDKLELETNTTLNEIATISTDYIAGYVPIETPSGQFYMILSRTGTT